MNDTIIARNIENAIRPAALSAEECEMFGLSPRPHFLHDGWAKSSRDGLRDDAKWLISTVLQADSGLCYTDLKDGTTIVTLRRNSHMVGTIMADGSFTVSR